MDSLTEPTAVCLGGDPQPRGVRAWRKLRALRRHGCPDADVQPPRPARSLLFRGLLASRHSFGDVSHPPFGGLSVAASCGKQPRGRQVVAWLRLSGGSSPGGPARLLLLCLLLRSSWLTVEGDRHVGARRSAASPGRSGRRGRVGRRGCPDRSRAGVSDTPITSIQTAANSPEELSGPHLDRQPLS
jgi:hypothetical protein